MTRTTVEVNATFYRLPRRETVERLGDVCALSGDPLSEVLGVR
ncbi:MAG: hypothetical protein WB297_17905 [Actinomycetota bacterium]